MAETEIDWVAIEAWRYPAVEGKFLFRHRIANQAARKFFLNGDRPPIWWKRKKWLSESERLESVMRDALGSLIRSPNIIVYGRADDPENDLEQVRILPLTEVVDRHDDESMISLGRLGAARKYFDVYIVPVLAAPGLAGKLTGFLDDVFAAHLWGDSEFAAVFEGFPARLPLGAGEEATALVPISDRAGTVRAGARAVLSRIPFDESGLELATNIVADRMARLFSVILSGELILAGRPSLDAAVDLVPADFWRRPSLSICLASATIFSDGNLAWSDLRVVPSRRGLGAAPHSSPSPAGLSEPMLTASQSALVDDDPYVEEEFDGRPKEKPRFEILDRIIVERIRIGAPAFSTLKELATFLAQTCQDSGHHVGSVHKRLPKPPVGVPVTTNQVRAAGEWIDRYLPQTRAELIKKMKPEA